jgi:hypothetical protein
MKADPAFVLIALFQQTFPNATLYTVAAKSHYFSTE